jgi:hypothetical protein
VMVSARQKGHNFQARSDLHHCAKLSRMAE